MFAITNLVPRIAIAAVVLYSAASHASPSDDLVIGELALTKVTDGDTIRVEGLDASLRLLGFDAEETFKSRADRRAFAEGWEQYEKAKRNGAARPVKFATPLGEDAKHFAIKFFEGAKTV